MLVELDTKPGHSVEEAHEMHAVRTAVVKVATSPAHGGVCHLLTFSGPRGQASSLNASVSVSLQLRL